MTMDIIEQSIMELKEHQAVCDAERKELILKVNTLNETVKVLNQLAEDVHIMAANMQVMQETLNKTVEKVEEVELEGYNKYKDTKKDVRKVVISGVVGAVVTAALSFIVAVANKYMMGGI